ncbi:MAG: cysteine--tRNA ligase [Clostridiales bacterium]|jgi:cysteinyl-tRNA synthetase|nr:cysteine--tRNA ligase [Clostridiales bacterium]HOB63855.1 cysteine--tRNA ligase [Clostridia bacterium]HOK82122.1 cysteine--tRNA ligase [Clostridia bacterium]HOL61062.1 cysteine--tRNA ligase [Clostridia bacterium]HPO53974.1 cysteine--tRNA ligase [Clostridia bacterium]
MLKFYNTLTRTKQDFEPLGKAVTMYSCGPTVYSYAHIGNLRTYIFMDLVRRALRYEGYKLKGVLNITDVGHLMADSDDGEDKMVQASRAEKKSPWEIAEYYTKVFFEDLGKLNIGRPEIIAKATDHINDMIKYVEALLEAGYAYETSDGIYFDIQKFEGYGKLSGAKLDEQIAGARVEVNSEKRHPADFALWKKADPLHIMQWDSPWGKGYPGWHIECSVMSQKYLGEVFDIHSGGVDHIPIHHENEIAQNEALTGKQSVNYWLHGEFMLVDGGKMSKSLGNTYTIAQLEEKGYSPMDFRFFCLNAHYRKKLNFTFDGMDAAKVSRERLLNQLAQHKASPAKTPAETLAKYRSEFKAAIEDDLNIPLALGVLFTAVKEPKSIDIYNLALEFDKVFGLSLDKLPAPKKEESAPLPPEIAELVEQRAAAKKNRDFALADSLRTRINEMGYNILDTRDGVVVTPIEK